MGSGMRSIQRAIEPSQSFLLGLYLEGRSPLAKGENFAYGYPSEVP